MKHVAKAPPAAPATPATAEAWDTPAAVEILPADAATPPPPADPALLHALLAQIGQDITNAEVGRFYALRAGIGLIVTREYIPHGEWGGAIAAAFPHRHPRTIRRYLKSARGFLEDRALMAAEVWPHIASIAPEQIAAAQHQQQRLLAEGSTVAAGETLQQAAPELPAEVLMMLEHLAPKEPEPAGTESKSLTAKEKRELAITTWERLGTRVTTEAVMRKSWLLLDLDQQEQLAAALRTAADEIQRALRKAYAKANL
ncbi:MAG: hypothetical protein M0Q49_02005 [Porticoccaceae bacterium]|nr:hypothetical protein [Porticoccaceae bacterium]